MGEERTEYLSRLRPWIAANSPSRLPSMFDTGTDWSKLRVLSPVRFSSQGLAREDVAWSIG
jgi:hypothetical protein